MQASNSLGVSDETRIRIENKICREEGPLPDCFEEPMENVLTLLEEVLLACAVEICAYSSLLWKSFFKEKSLVLSGVFSDISGK
jgi:hypothetical protein